MNDSVKKSARNYKDNKPVDKPHSTSRYHAADNKNKLRFHKRISFKLARIGVVVAFLLGLTLSSIQVYYDFNNQGRELDAEIGRILSVVALPAARAVHLLDEDLADEVIQGLMEYEFISDARIVDDLGVPLADNSRPRKDSTTRWITKSIKGETKPYSVVLETTGVRNVAPGMLHVTVDVDAALTGFFDRSLFVLTTGIVRNMILVVLFFIAFYIILTKPLHHLISSFERIDPEDPGNARFEVSSDHDDDELGQLANSGNNFLDSIAHHLEDRNTAQEELEATNNDLERRVEERTVDLRREITERKYAEESLQELNASLEQIVEERTYEMKMAKEMAEFASRSKSQFLANMSHELRTPLNAIIGFSKIMKDEMFGPINIPKYLEYSGDIQSSSSHLLNVIGDILDVSKIEAGELILDIEDVDFFEVATASKLLMVGMVTQKGLALDVNIPTDFPKIQADQLRVKQIIINLFSNAVKFTPKGGVIKIEAARNADGGATFSVIDTGIGIPEADISRVLEPFGQVDDIMTRSHEGTGLGLSLCKSLMEQHDGTLILESELGKGTTILINFPAERVVG